MARRRWRGPRLGDAQSRLWDLLLCYCSNKLLIVNLKLKQAETQDANSGPCVLQARFHLTLYVQSTTASIEKERLPS